MLEGGNGSMRKRDRQNHHAAAIKHTQVYQMYSSSMYHIPHHYTRTTKFRGLFTTPGVGEGHVMRFYFKNRLERKVKYQLKSCLALLASRGSEQ